MSLTQLLPSRDLSYSIRFAELLRARGFSDPEQIESFLNAGLDDLADPFTMKGMPEAVRLIKQTISEGGKILIHGDYDVDGITSTAILAETLKVLKGNFSTFLPDRQEDGYGVSGKAIQQAYRDGVSLFVTADCGVTALEEISAARKLGMHVLVVDHHRIPSDGMPPANVILNPLQEDCDYSFKELSAGGLAFKLSQALIGNRAFQFLDLVAMSTIADVAPLVGENRILVKHGLKLLSERKHPGLRALARVASLKTRELNAGHVAFILAPRINAAGRMSFPDTALRLLLTASDREAESLARALDEENKLRQKEERQVLREALEEIERTVNFNRDRILVVGRNGWHPGVVGIVASRMVERVHRPAVVFSLEGGRGKGSGRSIKNFHLFNALTSCKDLFEEFGGHEQAAGVVIREEYLGDFRKRINQYALEHISADMFERKIRIDLELNLSDLRFPFIRELALLEPHGIGNPRPVFLTQNLTTKGKPHRLNPQTIQFWVTDGSSTFECIFTDQESSVGVPNHPGGFCDGKKLHIAYSVKTREWDGMERILLEVKEVNPLPG
ncbi:MAG: single-stranded-DNA-specific exonuclease RecJ [Candidatus Omnitrophica bacterium]|nr:single-stranded-DNA-specific exonuclease RecJ [Candidatus Omnitrophota bacterium]